MPPKNLRWQWERDSRNHDCSWYIQCDRSQHKNDSIQADLSRWFLFDVSLLVVTRIQAPQQPNETPSKQVQANAHFLPTQQTITHKTDCRLTHPNFKICALTFKHVVLALTLPPHSPKLHVLCCSNSKIVTERSNSSRKNSNSEQYRVRGHLSV